MSTAEVEPPHSDSVEKNALGIEYSSACAVGSRLKNARESNSMTKEFIARRAKIRERYIDAIELGDWDILPPGLNGRGLVRLYAKELGVLLPEFEGFSNLQTIQAEKQSETLSHNNFIKKSRYQPAAEESAEIIKIVPRSEYKNVGGENHYTNIYNHHSHEIMPSSTGGPSKFYQSKTHHSSTAIITPKISDVIGIELATFNNSTDSSDLNVLPLAKPVNKTKKIHSVKMETEVNEEAANNETFPAPMQMSEIASEQNMIHTDIVPATKQKIKLNKKFFVYTLVPIVFLSLIYGIYVLNSQNHKLDSQPLLTSERKLINANEQNAASGSIKSAQVAPPDKTLPASVANTAPAVQTPAVEPKSAKVDILARVKIQVIADGEEVFSGYHQPGPLEFSFKDKAEILVYDASKVKLTYGTWEHGELGWNERKRKIILNAKPYEE